MELVARKSYEEIDSLYASFNHMVQVLREKGLMEKLISKSAREKVRRQIQKATAAVPAKKQFTTILFSDIRGFTAYAESHSPLDVLFLLNKYLDVQAKIVEQKGGDVDKFMGDAIMAIFEGQKGGALALEAALEIRRELQNLETSTKLSVGIGVHCGEVVSGYVGSQGRADFTVIGDAVNFTSRLCDGAGEWEIWVSQELVDHSGGKFVFQEKGTYLFKGKTAPQKVFLLVNARGADSF